MNEDTTYQNVLDAAKAVLIAVNNYIKKEDILKSITFYLRKKPEKKKGQTKWRAIRRKEKIKVRMETNESGNGKTLENINKTKNCFF